MGGDSSRSGTPDPELGERRSPEQGLLRLQDPGGPRRTVAPIQSAVASAAAAAAAAHARHMSVHSYGSAGGGGGGGFESPSGASQSDPANTATPAHADHARHHSNRSLSQLQLPLQPQAAPVPSGPTLSPPITRQLLAPSPVLPSPENDAASGSPAVAADSGADGSDTTADFSSFRPAARHGHTGSVELSPLPMLHHLTSAAVHRSSPGHTVQIAPIDPSFAPSSHAALNADAAKGAAPPPSGSAPASSPAAAAAATGDAAKGTSPSS